MAKNIVVEFPKITPIEEYDVEVVERKGIGHPDSLCDGIAEAVSRALSREYIERFGRVLHHNTDQVELVGGAARPEFGGGEMIKPVYILLSGRATTRVGKERIPVAEIAIHAAKEYLKNTLRHVDVEEFAEIHQRMGEGSADLKHIFEEKGIPRANDTSLGVGYAPLSTTEKVVLEAERFINTKLRMREVGEDVKVMGVRHKTKIKLTIAAAIVSRYVFSLDDYIEVVKKLKEKVKDHLEKITDKELEIYVNTADDYEKGSVYLTYTGTSAEQGDDGSVGRGNRVNGLITPYRPVSLEASSGKNPVNHVGKLYNILAFKIAQEIYEESGSEVHVRLLSQIGKPINEPFIASIQILGERDKNLEKEAKRIAEHWLDNISEITKLCIEGKISTF